MKQRGEIILYQPDDKIRLEVRLENETVWLTQAQMASLFDVKEHTITYHIKEIYSSEELDQIATTRKIRVVRKEGNRNVSRQLDFYNLDLIISVGYRVNSKRGVQFRIWSTSILKDYLLKGYAINQRIEKLEKTVSEHDEKIGFFVRTSLPPVEGVFFNGQIFDAYVFVANLIRSAKKSLVLIDNYIDESVLLTIGKRNPGVSAIIYTGNFNRQLQLDLERYNSQYPEIIIREYKQSHDRFLIIDKQVYHIGASLKDLGKKLFAFSKLDIDAKLIIPKE